MKTHCTEKNIFKLFTDEKCPFPSSSCPTDVNGELVSCFECINMRIEWKIAKEEEGEINED